MKTRLAPALGFEGAAALHERLLLRTLRTARRAGIGPVVLYCAPSRETPYFRRFAPRQACRSQRGADLGERMHRAFQEVLRRHPRAVLVGTDCPALRPSDLRAAAAALASGCLAVFSPAEDGGYPLIGLRRSARRLFEGIAWGGPAVMAQTRRRVAALRWRARYLRELWDVDRPADARRLAGSGILDR